MKERLLTLERLYQKEYEYILDQLHEEKILFAPHEVGRRYAIDTVTTSSEQERALKDILSEVLFTSFKWDYFTKAITKRDSVEDLAILYALLDVESERERKYFCDKFFDERELHLDAIYNFSISDIKASWDDYVYFVKKFYEKKPDRDDKLEFIAYFLSMNIKNDSSPKREMYVSSVEREKILQNLFYYRRKDCAQNCEDKDVERLVSDLFGNCKN